MENQFFKAIPLMEGVTAIAGLGGEYAYLVEGSERALLIDGLVGVGSLKAFVRELTSLPVKIALTHGHIDHNGAAYEYGECYIHPYDIPMLYPCPTEDDGSGLAVARHSDPKAKLDFVVNGRILQGDARGITLDDVVKPVPIRTYPIFEGDVFDLGGTQIEVLELPGHTNGTVVFLDRARRIIFSGDACNMNTLLGIPGSTTIEDYKEALEAFSAKHGDAFDCMYGGHGTQPVPAEIIPQAIALCGRILSGQDDHVPAEHRGVRQYMALKRGERFAPANGCLCNIMYTDEKLHKQAKPHVIKNVPIAERK